MPGQFYAHHVLRFRRDRILPLREVRALLIEHGFTCANVSYEQHAGGELFEYRMVISTTNPDDMERLAQTLRRRPEVAEFRIAVRGK